MSLGRGLCVTGTDTGVGKTVVAVALTAALRRRGVSVGVMKPIETGCRREGNRLIPEDALRLQEAAGCEEPIERIVPYAFSLPAAPAAAAREAGEIISLPVIEEALGKLLSRYSVVVVEGAGGLLVPVSDRLLTLDLIRYLGLPLLVVAHDRLGTLNHTLLTVRAALGAGLTVLGVILNSPTASREPGEEENLRLLPGFLTVPLLGRLRYLGAEGGRDVALLAEAAEKHLDLTLLMDHLAGKES